MIWKCKIFIEFEGYQVYPSCILENKLKRYSFSWITTSAPPEILMDMVVKNSLGGKANFYDFNIKLNIYL